MRPPKSVRALEELGRIRLSPSFFMRDMLYSEIANFHGMTNIPENPDMAVAVAKCLCSELLEPLQEKFGRISIRSAYRSPTLNHFGNEHGYNCGSNEYNYAGHIFDRRDKSGHMGATATIIVNSFIDYYERTSHWQAIAWWIHDHLPYSKLYFFPKYAAFNITWREHPERIIKSYVPPKGTLTKPGMSNFDGDHENEYASFVDSLKPY